jgi:hypothetical protein
VHQFGTRLFGPTVRAEFAHEQPHTIASMVALMGTHSQVLVMPDAERAELLRAVADYLRSRPETASGEFVLPMVTVAVRAVRH